MDNDITQIAIADCQGSALTTTKEYDPRVKSKAYELFLTTDLSLSDIAIELGLRSEVVGNWSRAGEWRVRRREIEAELFKSADDQYRRILIEQRVPTIERHLRVSKQLEEAIERVVQHELSDPDHIPNDMRIKRMAEALSAVTGVSARAAGITDRPFSDGSDESRKGKVPLIMIGVNARPSDIIVDADITDA